MIGNAIQIHNMRRLVKDRGNDMFTYKFDRETTNTLLEQAVISHHLGQLQDKWSTIKQDEIEQSPCQQMETLKQEKEELQFLIQSDEQQKQVCLQSFDIAQAQVIDQTLQQRRQQLHEMEVAYEEVMNHQNAEYQKLEEENKKHWQLQAYEIVKSYIDKLSIEEIDLLLSKQDVLQDKLGDYYQDLKKERLCLKK